MEIKTHVLTNPQNLSEERKLQARKNIDLGNVENTSDMDKPVSTAQQAAIDALGTTVDGKLAGKVDKEAGKGLSTNDFDNEYKNKVDESYEMRHSHSNQSELDQITRNAIASAETTDEGKTLVLHPIEGEAVTFSGEQNAINTISQNGVTLPIDNKNVEITETIQSISVNGTPQTITEDHNVDIHIDTPVSPYDENPEMDGTATPGQSSAYARGDHAHPSDTTKADKVSGAISGNFAGLNANGNLTDSGSKAADFATAAQGALAETAYQKPDGGIPKTDLSEGVQTSLGKADTALQEHQDISGKEDKTNKVADWSGTPDDEHYPTEKLVKVSLDQIDTDLASKADKVANATSGNFAGLDTNGNLTDSGSKASDFAIAAQGAKADTAIQGVRVNGGAEIVPDANKVVDIEVDSIVPPTHNGEWIWSDEKDDSNSMGWRQIIRDYVGNIQRDDTTGEPILDEEGHPITDAEDVADAVELWLRYKGIEFAARRAYDDETGENIHTAIHNRTTMAQVVEAIETALANYGGFKVVPLVNGVPDPSPDLPSEKFIYLTKEDPSAKTDPYTEWIWIAGTPDGHWDCIGETSIDLTGYWHGGITQEGSGNVVTGISVVSGEVTVTKGKTVSDGANKVEASLTNGNILIDGVETQVCDISGKADKVANATAGNFAGLDGNGNLTNSDSKAADFATAAQGTKADSAVQGVQKNGTDIALDANNKANVVVNDAEFKVKLGSGSATTVFSADADTDSTLNIPLAAADSSSATTVYTEGLMAGEDKEKLDGITDYVVNASVSGRTLTLTSKNGQDTTFTDTGDTNVIESISVNGTAQTITNKNVDLTIPDDANDATITIEVGGAASGEPDPVAGDFSTDQDTDETITIPAAVSATQNTPAQPGVMSSADKEKLDGIEAGAEVNVIESIEVNGVAQTVTDKTVDITVPTVNDGELSITVGSGNAVTFTANQSSNTSVNVPLASKDTSGATPVYSEGLMTSAQNEKLDGIAASADVNVIESITMEGESNPLAIVNKDVEIPLATSSTPGLMSAQDKDALDSIAAFSSIQVTSGSTTGQVDADSATETLHLVASDNITLTANNTTKTIEISASLGAELGFLSGSATVNGIVNNGDVLTDPLTGMVNSNNGRFIIDTDTDDGHVYLYALKSIPDLVNGVDLFTISVNSNVSRTTANGFYGVAGLEILHKDNGNSLITESTESYASQVGECSVDLTVTVKNSTGTVTTIDGVDYYGYLIRYAGDSTASGDAINVVTRISVIEETVGIVEYDGSQSSLSAGNGISIDNDTINANLGDGLGLDSNNNIEVKVGAGLKIDTSGGVATVAIDNVTEQVVEEVQKLGEDLDKKITTTFPYAQITTMSDYMSYGTQGENRMIGQLFSVPITSELRVDGTVICVNALQSAPNIDVVFGIFEYDFSANNGSGSTYWLADTGVVHVAAGDNAFPIKNLINDVTRPSIELKSSCLYYAVWAIHNTGASNGLVLASCPGYGANYNAIPRYTVKTSGAPVQVNWAGDGCLRNSWFSGYNEDNSIPRLFMMVRNKSDIQPSGNDPFIDITDYDLVDQYTINQIFGSTAPSADGAVFQKVIPARAVNITKFEWADTKSAVTATSTSPMVMDNSFGTTLTLADGTLTTAQDGDYYVHTFTLTNALAMTAGTVYWLPAQYNTVTETGMSDGGDNKLVQYNTNVARRDLQMIVDMAQPSGSSEFKASQTGAYLKLYDDNNNSWVI